MMKAVLALENGTWCAGRAVGATGVTAGEVVFNTSMTDWTLQRPVEPSLSRNGRTSLSSGSA
jgi:carbamoyl-phosphate synthase small subunit